VTLAPPGAPVLLGPEAAQAGLEYLAEFVRACQAHAQAMTPARDVTGPAAVVAYAEAATQAVAVFDAIELPARARLEAAQ
jgi:hypothetical protein